MRAAVTLSRPLRTQLENTVKAARDVAEKGARAALDQLTVAEAKAPDYLTEELKALRRRLRAHGRSLGDAKAKDDTQGVKHLVWEVAYEHWHRMLFARFLAENGLLMWEPGASVSLDDCRDMVDNHPDIALGAKSNWELAGKLAARMLPQVFKPHSPVFELTFAPEHQRELERLLAGLPNEILKASDSLGWVYQFWQAKRKDEVNDSGEKIGADELSAVTQLFTEPYMVEFLLHNSLGAWWVTRHPGKTCPVPLTYLRTLDDGTPAAGKFEGWPNRLQDFKLLDPCCGSGHFLVAAFLMLVPMRMEAEGLSAMDAVDAVLAENLHGLELDARCVEIAVFALALAAWRFPDENGDPLGVRIEMPAPQVACCGLKVAAKPENWTALVPDDTSNAVYLRQELRLLHASFAQAPLLGSLLNLEHSLKNDLATSSLDTLRDLMGRALATERPTTLWGTAGESQEDTWDLAFTASGLLDAARILEVRYNLVITNVPYLARGRQDAVLKDFCNKYYEDARQDLANVFFERCLELACADDRGVAQVVMPQGWLYLDSYRKQRESLLNERSWKLLARLGTSAFETISGQVVSVQLLTIGTGKPENNSLFGIDVSIATPASAKAASLITSALTKVSQKSQLLNPDARVTFQAGSDCQLLEQYCIVAQGISTTDGSRFVQRFWEIQSPNDEWEFFQTASEYQSQTFYSGLAYRLRWGGPGKDYFNYIERMKEEGRIGGAWQQGRRVWGQEGFGINVTSKKIVSVYIGGKFDVTVAAVVPKTREMAPAVLAYLSSDEYVHELRKIDPALSVTEATLLRVPFDAIKWQNFASELFPEGVPRPYARDPAQAIFHGHPSASDDPLQVATGRLLGYRWPAETDASIELSDDARSWIAACKKLDEQTDNDGIVCLPSVRGEPPAHERLLKLLIAGWETVHPGTWKPSVLDNLLAEGDCAGKGLDVWLRDKFFEQHAKRFHHRPFIWHVWDGLKDGFGALVNYHKLDAKNLERLIHTYLGDWIRQQEAGVRDGGDGAQTRLAAAHDLKRRLELILEGEAPYDIFVRWKPLAEQPIGWNPDLNDGVRLNIRAFITAEVLRHNRKPKLNITWDKDRGKDVESAPWFKVFKGERINDHHLTLAEKKAAR